jgi:hypothetical protein
MRLSPAPVESSLSTREEKGTRRGKGTVKRGRIVVSRIGRMAASIVVVVN